MAPTVPHAQAPRHLLRSESGSPMLKADLRKADINAWGVEIGRAVTRVRLLAGLSLKEFAVAIDRDERQVARWESGKEHAQLAAIFCVAAFTSLMVLALAEIANGVEIETTLRIKELRVRVG